MRVLKSLIPMILGIALSGPLAFAKRVKIEWKPVEAAIQYEIQIQRDMKVVVQATLESPKWKGDLEPGAYFFQIRAIDQAKRPGAWSEIRSLAVMPPPPEVKYPPNGAEVSLFHPQAKTVLQWKEIPGVKEYSVVLKKDGKVVSKTVAKSPNLPVSSLPPGNYSWTVNSILETGNRAPASAQGKTWETDAIKSGEFRVSYRRLGAAKLIFPKGMVMPPESNRIKLKWKPVEGAQAYEVRLLRTNKSLHDRTLASDLGLMQKYVTKDTTYIYGVSGQGSYVWSVRALANLDENNKPQAAGPESAAKFKLDKNAIFQDDLGYLAVSGMIAPYTYSINSPSNSYSGGTGSTSVVARLSGEYWIHPQWGIAAGFDYATFTIENRNFGRPAAELFAKYRLHLGIQKNGWSISPKLGAEVRDYNQLLPSDLKTVSGDLVVNDIYTVGGVVGIDIRKQFTESFGAGLRFSYFYPIVFIGSNSSSTIGGEASKRNFNVGLQGLYWVSPNVGFGLGGFYDQRSIGYTPSGRSSTEEIYMDAFYFFGSFVYRFWK